MEGTHDTAHMPRWDDGFTQVLQEIAAAEAASRANRISRTLVAIAAFAAATLCVFAAVFARRSKREREREAQAAIDLANRAYLDALIRSDAAAYADLFTDDAVSMPARGAMVRGKDAIEASVEQSFERVRFHRGDLRTSGTRVDGATAYESGHYSFDVTTDGVPATLEGRYLVVWRKAGDEWKIAIDASQPGAPP